MAERETYLAMLSFLKALCLGSIKALVVQDRYGSDKGGQAVGKNGAKRCKYGNPHAMTAAGSMVLAHCKATTHKFEAARAGAMRCPHPK